MIEIYKTFNNISGSALAECFVRKESGLNVCSQPDIFKPQWQQYGRDKAH